MFHCPRKPQKAASGEYPTLVADLVCELTVQNDDDFVLALVNV